MFDKKQFGHKVVSQKNARVAYARLINQNKHFDQI